MHSFKLISITSFAALALLASGCVSTYDAGVRKAVTPRPTYGPEYPAHKPYVPVNPRAPKPKPDVKSPVPHPGYNNPYAKPGQPYNYANPVPPARQPAGPAGGNNNVNNNKNVNNNNAVARPADNGVARPSADQPNKNSNPIAVPRPSNTHSASDISVSRAGDNTNNAVSRPSNSNTNNNVPAARPSQTGQACRTDADCYNGDKCLGANARSTVATGHCVRQ